MLNSFMEFIDSSKTAFHAVENIKALLISRGFEEIRENDAKPLAPLGKYFVTRNGSSLIAFKNRPGAFVICASHSDSPTFKVKSDERGAAYVRLSTEKYGGMIHYTWLDRPLGIAGRVVVKTERGIKTVLADLESSVIIPSVAIHLNRSVNESCNLNPARDLIPLAGLKGAPSLTELVALSCGCEKEDVLSHDLFLYPKAAAEVIGFSDELICAPRIDNLASAYLSALAFADDNSAENTPVLAVFDNEEVGSSTKQGAASAFLADTLLRIANYDRGELVRRLCDGFMASIDNAHALHPNHPELYDASNAPLLGSGVVIKHNANQRYTTDAVSEAIFKRVCARAGVKTSSYYNRPDIPGGSTLGSISNTVVPINTVDIGLPQLAMHSSYETAAVSDLYDMKIALSALYATSLSSENGETVIS